MKIAVYTICKNEAKFLKRWLDSAKEADYLIVTDTGSTDDTLTLLKRYSKKDFRQLSFNEIKLEPWRFDDARNFNLMSIPSDADVCICLDMDEVLLPGWRKEVEEAYSKGNCDRLRYNYVWSWNEDDSPAVTYHADKIHKRHGYRWVNPVHEVLARDIRLGKEDQVFIAATLIYHFPDENKSRSNYLPLLELSVNENPWNDRNAHYYARELMFAGFADKAIQEFKRHLSLPSAQWDAERSASWRYMGDCYWSLEQYQEAVDAFAQAIEEAPNTREPYISMAQAYRVMENWQGVVDMTSKALAITSRPSSYINQPSAWGTWPKEMLDEAIQKLKTNTSS